MRSLSSTLLAAQRSGSGLPYVKVEIVERVAGVARLSWNRLYSGTESDFYHAAIMPGDGSLIRARVDSGDYHLYLQRVTNPDENSDYSLWTDLGVVSDVSGIALCSQGATVLLFYVGTNQRTIYIRESTDYGASFSGALAILSPDSAVGWLAADINDDGVVALFYSVGGVVYVIKRTNGVWGLAAAWTNSASAVTGLACIYHGDWNIAVSGKDSSNNYKVWTCVYGDGYSQSSGIWSVLAELAMANADSNVEFHCPFVDFPDVFRTFFIEKYSGSASYSRPLWSHSLASADFISNLWREPVSFDLSSSYGLALASGTSYAWLSMPSGVWRAALSPSSVDVSSDVIGLATWIEPASGRVRVELRNDDGRYGDIGSGSYAAIKKGSELLVSPGYRTTVGIEVSLGPAYWIEGWEYISEGAKAGFILQASDGWGLLEHWKARRQFSWSAGTKSIFQLLRFIFARVGLELSSFSTSNAIVNQCPAFTIHPEESGATAAQRLLAMVPDVLLFRGGCGYVKNPQESDQSDYSYGSNHPLWRGHYASACSRFNRVQVYGDGVMCESFIWAEMSKVFDRLRQVHDLNLDTEQEAQERAQAELRHQLITADRGEILVPVNCGQELYDVIDITDERAGLTAAKRRLRGLMLNYSTRGREAGYEERLLLGGV